AGLAAQKLERVLLGAEPRRADPARVAPNPQEGHMPDWKSLIRARVAPLSELDAAREADIVDELAQHVAEHYAELVAAGVAGTDAVERALAPLNDPARIAREIARADRPRRSAPAPPPTGGSWMGHF